MPGIFISYRRSDTEGYAGRLFEGLKARFGEDRVYFDVADAAPGQDFHDAIDKRIGACDVLLALVGNTWASATDRNGRRRLDDPEDLVRLEIAAALNRGVTVVPVLLQGAVMPRRDELPHELEAFARHNAMELRHTRWEADVAALLDALAKSVKRSWRLRFRWRRWIVASVVAIALLALAWWFLRVDVPDVVGLPTETAKAVILSEHLGYRVTESDQTVGAYSRVLDQRPAAGRRVGIGARVELSATKSVDRIASQAASPARDAEFERALVGTWRSRKTHATGAFLDTQGTLRPGGNASWTGHILYQYQRTPIVLSGKWWVKDGKLNYKIETTNVPNIIPSGHGGDVEIVDVTPAELIHVDPADGKTYVDLRAK